MSEYDICQCESDIYDTMESRLMQMTFWAHKAVLFEKIKQKIEEQEGEKLEKIADLLVEASRIRAKTEQEAEKNKQELKDKLKETFEE